MRKPFPPLAHSYFRKILSEAPWELKCFQSLAYRIFVLFIFCTSYVSAASPKAKIWTKFPSPIWWHYKEASKSKTSGLMRNVCLKKSHFQQTTLMLRNTRSLPAASQVDESKWYTWVCSTWVICKAVGLIISFYRRDSTLKTGVLMCACPQAFAKDLWNH